MGDRVTPMVRLAAIMDRIPPLVFDFKGDVLEEVEHVAEALVLDLERMDGGFPINRRAER